MLLYDKLKQNKSKNSLYCPSFGVINEKKLYIVYGISSVKYRRWPMFDRLVDRGAAPGNLCVTLWKKINQSVSSLSWSLTQTPTCTNEQFFVIPNEFVYFACSNNQMSRLRRTYWIFHTSPVEQSRPESATMYIFLEEWYYLLSWYIC